ncbi:hypothetical protein M378DRAFT_201107 [Amanita muscaria Koide BX008]|uniref:Uncharacterized protein n=1 Tax=Amanita muscaria (strain Koide BX008) TaxID=946122 RepID=A0A0C2RYL4_AMAMK|nr:hypothetical protein M378DRAFT_201107 [Amanita muscaria Koide BX008]
MICSRKSAPKFARALRAHQIRCPSILRVVQTNNCSTTRYTHPPFASGNPYPFAFTPPPVAHQTRYHVPPLVSLRGSVETRQCRQEAIAAIKSTPQLLPYRTLSHSLAGREHTRGFQ